MSLELSNDSADLPFERFLMGSERLGVILDH